MSFVRIYIPFASTSSGIILIHSQHLPPPPFLLTTWEPLSFSSASPSRPHRPHPMTLFPQYSTLTILGISLGGACIQTTSPAFVKCITICMQAPAPNSALCVSLSSQRGHPFLPSLATHLILPPLLIRPRAVEPSSVTCSHHL